MFSDSNVRFLRYRNLAGALLSGRLLTFPLDSIPPVDYLHVVLHHRINSDNRLYCGNELFVSQWE